MTFPYDSIAFLLPGLIGAGITWRADSHRRRLSRFKKSNILSFLDVICVATSVGLATTILVASPHYHWRTNTPFTPATFGILVCALLLLFLWSEGRHQIQLQRPAGIVFAEWVILFGFLQAALILVFRPDRSEAFWILSSIFVAVGTLVLAAILPPFLGGHEEHRILEHLSVAGEFTQPEYVGPTRECPFPSKWKMLDAQSAEVEVLGYLRSLIETVKPDLIVETGTFIGHSAMKMAEGLKANGFGKIITIEYDPLVFAKAKQNIHDSGLTKWIEYRNASSLETLIDEPIDILFSDSDINIRESEIRRFLPQIKPRGLVVVHDASSSVKVVREAALQLEKEGLLSVVLLSTPRGLVIAQKREGRT